MQLKKILARQPLEIKLMKKSLLALAVLGAFAASAQAQTAVTIYGSFDGGIRHTTDVNAAGDNRTTVGSNGTYNSNRIGFRGVEDLGGGLKARFTLENGFNTGTGALNNTTNRLFERTAAVGFGGDFGFIDIGRQYTNAFLTVIQYDPFSFKYPAITGLSTPITDATAGTRYDNDVKYTGTFGPVTARAEYAFGEAAGSASRGSSASVSASYATGPLAIGGAFTRRNDRGATAAGAAGPDNDHFTVGGAYKLGPVRLTAGYSRDEQDAATGSTVENKNRNAWVGV